MESLKTKTNVTVFHLNKWMNAMIVDVHRDSYDVLLQDSNSDTIQIKKSDAHRVIKQKNNEKIVSIESTSNKKRKHTSNTNDENLFQLKEEVFKYIREQFTIMKNDLQEFTEKAMYFKLQEFNLTNRIDMNNNTPVNIDKNILNKQQICSLCQQKAATHVSIIHLNDQSVKETYRNSNDDNFKKYIKYIKRLYGVCTSCKTDHMNNTIFIDIKNRHSVCAICKVNKSTMPNDVPVCSSCETAKTSKKEGVLAKLLSPFVNAFSGPSRFPYMKIEYDACLHNTVFRPDSVLKLKFYKDSTLFNAMIVVERDENEHQGREEDDKKKIKQIISDFSHNHIFVIRVNTSSYHKNGVTTLSPTFWDRLVVTRCWMLWYLLHIREMPRYIHLYLYYSNSHDKKQKHVFQGNCDIDGYSGLGYAWGAPRSHEYTPFIYSLEPTEGEIFSDTNPHNKTWGKHLTSQREVIRDVFPMFDSWSLLSKWDNHTFLNVIQNI